jgi:hypothetical protein
VDDTGAGGGLRIREGVVRRRAPGRLCFFSCDASVSSEL